MELTGVEVRVLGVLLEKQVTTPDLYPLTVAALLSACNQTTNRVPVVRYDEATVSEALAHLRQIGLTRIVYSTSNRAPKHRHVLDEAWSLDGAQRAVLCLLMVRGPQTAGEIKGRTERLHPFASVGEVDEVLDDLAGRAEPLVVRLARQPGQKEARNAHLLSGPVDEAVLAAFDEGAAPARRGPSASEERLAALEARVAALETELASLAELRSLLG